MRFLLPAFPALIVLSVAAAAELLRKLVRAERAALALLGVAICALAVVQATDSVRRRVFLIQDVERRYVEVGRYINLLPRESIFVAGLHAGSIRYYSGRMTINFDRLDRDSLDAALAAVAANGFRPYLALEKGEEEAFRKKFSRSSEVARLDWPPAHETEAGTSVHIFDPADRERFLAGLPTVTYQFGAIGDRVGVVGDPIITEK